MVFTLIFIIKQSLLRLHDHQITESQSHFKPCVVQWQISSFAFSSSGSLRSVFWPPSSLDILSLPVEIICKPPRQWKGLSQITVWACPVFTYQTPVAPFLPSLPYFLIRLPAGLTWAVRLSCSFYFVEFFKTQFGKLCWLLNIVTSLKSATNLKL